jgi:hypothetical protein
MLHQVGSDRETMLAVEEYKFGHGKMPALSEEDHHGERQDSMSSDASGTNGDVEMKDLSRGY